MSVLAGIHRAPYAARSRISRTSAGPPILRGLRGTHGVDIACLRDRVEMFFSDIHLMQAARHAEIADEFVQHVGGVLAGLAHRFGDQRLAVCIG